MASKSRKASYFSGTCSILCNIHHTPLTLNHETGANWICNDCQKVVEESAERFMGTLPTFKKHEEKVKPVLPLDKEERKRIPIATGVLDYFPNALAEIAKVSYQGNVQHNAGQPLHWARNKSTDQDDTIIRHFLERGKLDEDGMRHSAKLAWRVLALLQLELEAEGAPIARGAKEE